MILTDGAATVQRPLRMQVNSGLLLRSLRAQGLGVVLVKVARRLPAYEETTKLQHPLFLAEKAEIIPKKSGKVL